MSAKEDLTAALEVLAKATPGMWEPDRAHCGKHGNETNAIYNVELVGSMRHVREVVETPCKCGDEAVSAEDSAGIIVAVNLLRTHGPTLLRALDALERLEGAPTGKVDCMVCDDAIVVHEIDSPKPLVKQRVALVPIDHPSAKSDRLSEGV